MSSPPEQIGKERPDERAALQTEISQVREDLGMTVEALANKADPKIRIRAAVRVALDGPAVPAGVAVVCALLLLRSMRG